jgi:NitT/TauT family transport system permease protein
VATTTPFEAEAPPVRVTEEELAKRARRKELIQRWFWRILSYIVVLSLWEYASGRVLEEALLPGPTRVIETFFDIIEVDNLGEFLQVWNWEKIPSAFQATLTRIIVGFGISFLVGATIGILMQNKWLEGFFKDAVLISLSSPGLIWVLMCAIIFGSRPIGPVIAIILTTFALVTVNVAEGIKALPKDLIDMGRAFHIGVVKRNRHVVIPHLAPFLFTGLRFGFSIAWKVTVLTEVFMGSEGIGFEMRVSSQLFQMDEFLTWILSFFFFALFLEKVVLEAIEKRYFRWRQAVTAS